MHCLLQISHVPALSYARLLGFRRQAAPVLSEFKKHSSIPVITKAADASSLLSDEAAAVFSKMWRFQIFTRLSGAKNIAPHLCMNTENLS